MISDTSRHGKGTIDAVEADIAPSCLDPFRLFFVLRLVVERELHHLFVAAEDGAAVTRIRAVYCIRGDENYIGCAPCITYVFFWVLFRLKRIFTHFFFNSISSDFLVHYFEHFDQRFLIVFILETL